MTPLRAPYSVYRMYDGDGVLLYIGCTSSIGNRIDQHRWAKQWWGRIDTIKVEHHSDYKAAYAAEDAAICAERPLYAKPRPRKSYASEAAS